MVPGLQLREALRRNLMNTTSLETLTPHTRLENGLITLGKENTWVIKTHHVCRA